MKSCHFYIIAQCSSKNSMKFSSFFMTFHDQRAPWSQVQHSTAMPPSHTGLVKKTAARTVEKLKITWQNTSVMWICINAKDVVLSSQLAVFLLLLPVEKFFLKFILRLPMERKRTHWLLPPTWITVIHAQYYDLVPRQNTQLSFQKKPGNCSPICCMLCASYCFLGETKSDNNPGTGGIHRAIYYRVCKQIRALSVLDIPTLIFWQFWDIIAHTGRELQQTEPSPAWCHWTNSQQNGDHSRRPLISN